MGVVISLIRTLFSVYTLFLVGRVFLEMLLGPYHTVVVFLRAVTEPVLAPIRRQLPMVSMGGTGWDLSPIVALVLLWVLERVLILVLTSLV